MTHQLISKVSMIAISATIAGCLLISGAPAQAQSQNSSNLFQSFGKGSCSNKTIKGDYGCSIQGSLIFGTTQLPFVAATTTRYDGERMLAVYAVDLFTVINHHKVIDYWILTVGTGGYRLSRAIRIDGIGPGVLVPTGVERITVDNSVLKPR